MGLADLLARNQTGFSHEGPEAKSLLVTLNNTRFDPSLARRPSFPVACIGAIHYDTIAHASKVYRPETSTPAQLASRPGGVATNVARNLAKLGIEVTLLGALGADPAGEDLTEKLTSEGIRLCTVRRKGYATGQYIAFHNPDGSLAAATVDDRVLSEASPDFFDPLWPELEPAPSPHYWFVDANLPDKLLQATVNQAPQGCLIANAVSDAKAPRLLPVLPKLSCLTLNRGEAIALTGAPADAANEVLADRLRQKGARRLVLTCGNDDVLAVDEGGVFRTPAPDARIVDVTGAGDALCAGILAALCRGLDFRQAVPIGLKAAALTLGSTGALSQTMSWDAVSVA